MPCLLPRIICWARAYPFISSISRSVVTSFDQSPGRPSRLLSRPKKSLGVSYEYIENRIRLQHAHRLLPKAISHTHTYVCGWEGGWISRLTAVEWHINECTAYDLHYKARALTWCPFNLPPVVEITFPLLHSRYACVTKPHELTDSEYALAYFLYFIRKCRVISLCPSYRLFADPFK
jgi:hypothetical protein